MPLLPIGHDRWSACIHHSRLAGGGSAQNILVAATGATTSGEE
jgi:hypothetical protein